jgi:6-hydroxynicotinate 3-monooxygenase
VIAELTNSTILISCWNKSTRQGGITMARPISVAVIGAGIGGLAVAATLRKFGIEVNVYEQTQRFMRLGAGIQMSPNAIKVLRAIGLEEKLRKTAFLPLFNHSRDWDTGKLTNEYPLGESAETRYGAPYLLMHRGDLHAALASAVPENIVHRNKKLIGFRQDTREVVMQFADGSDARADMMIGADGVHSRVREIMFGAEAPRYTGRVAYRTTFPTRLLNGLHIDPNTKWWGPDRHIVIYFVTSTLDEIYFTTSNPEPAMNKESWSAKGDLKVLRDAFAGFHPQVRGVLEACPDVHKWALFERDPLSRWTVGRVTLLGDSCHPMTPYMAQGAATSMEDAAVLARCLEHATAENLDSALFNYESLRKDRTARIQQSSHTNTWMQRSTDPEWVFGYDAWTVPVPPTTNRRAS